MLLSSIKFTEDSMGMYDMGMPDLGVCRGGMHNIVMQSMVKIKPAVPTLL
jgi:hypothetical protein